MNVKLNKLMHNIPILCVGSSNTLTRWEVTMSFLRFLFGVGLIGSTSAHMLVGHRLYDEPYDLDCLSFFEVETIVKKFGY